MDLRNTIPPLVNTMDVRYIVPAMVNNFLILWLGWSWKLVVSFDVQQFSVLEPKLVIALMLLLLFLFTSVEVSLNLGPIRLRAGNFSIALTTLLLASIFLPPSHFWAVYLPILFSSPWHHKFFQQLRRFFQLFSNALSSIRTYSIDIVVWNEKSPNCGSSPLEVDDDLELGLGHIQDGDQANQQNSETDD